MTTTIEVRGETLTYCGENYLAADEKDARQKLSEFGVAIIPDCLSKQECEEMNEGMWSTMEHLTKQLHKPVVNSKRISYKSIFELQAKEGGLFQHLGSCAVCLGCAK